MARRSTCCSTTWPAPRSFPASSSSAGWITCPRWRERLYRGRPTRPMTGHLLGVPVSGSSALRPDGSIVHNQNTAYPEPLADPSDPLGWHELDEPPVPAMRRARRIDVWDEDGTLGIDAMFRDSAWDPDGRELVVHEYQLLGQADRASACCSPSQPCPRVLPYAECPGRHRTRLEAGTELRAMRTEVLASDCRRTDCCTHLNDGAALTGRGARARHSAAAEPIND